MNKSWKIWGFTLGAISVGLGALGAHSLQPLLGDEKFRSFDTGVKYLMLHAILMAALGIGSKTALPKTGFRLFLAGQFCFSGSIFLLSTRTLTGLEGLHYLWPVTPLGGLLLMAGWMYMAICTIREKQTL
jgi:uncharacterized membrane protein YgdD (TMEM256/DUF423 family)